jgi:hypothetical protein
LGSLLAAALTRAHDFLLEPAVEAQPRVGGEGAGSGHTVQAWVVGTCAGCGVSTVAAGLRLMLSSLDRPAAQVTDVAWSAAGHEALTACAGTVVLVTPGDGLPPVASLVASLLKERVHHLVLVANRVGDENAWTGHAEVCVPDSRFGAALVARGRRPPGALGLALAKLASLVERGPAQ